LVGSRGEDSLSGRIQLTVADFVIQINSFVAPQSIVRVASKCSMSAGQTRYIPLGHIIVPTTDLHVTRSISSQLARLGLGILSLAVRRAGSSKNSWRHAQKVWKSLPAIHITIPTHPRYIHPSILQYDLRAYIPVIISPQEHIFQQR